MIYNSFFVTKGFGVNPLTELASIDLAYINAGFNHNLIRVSSILPKNCTRIDSMPEIPFGAMIHGVVSIYSGKSGSTISAGIAYATGYSKKFNQEFGIVAEAHGDMNEDELKEELKTSLYQMLDFRDMSNDKEEFMTTSLQVGNAFGTALVALVYFNR